MSNVAHLPILADRYGACVRQIYVTGMDLTGVAMRAQVRLGGDVPGAPLVDLLTVTNGNAEGLRLIDVEMVSGVPTSHVEMVVNETTMEGLPFGGERGDVTRLAWDWQATLSGRKRRLAKGEFAITGDGVTGAEVAPASRVGGGSFGDAAGGGSWNAARLTFGEDVVRIVLDGVDLLAPYARSAQDALDRINSFTRGPAGPAANTRATLAALKAAATTDMTSLYDGSVWFFVAGNYAGRADDATIVKANTVALSAGAWVRQVNAVLRPGMFGARGDGVTNDNAAFRAMTAVVNALGGGVTIDLEGKTYIIGAQEFAGAASKGYAYRPLHTLFFSGCTKLVTVQGNGARLKYASGLRFGAFDPVTGTAKSGISTNQDFRADAGYTIIGFNCPGGLEVSGLEIDGSVDDFVLGGMFGDTGYQLGHYGVYWEKTPGRAVLVHVHHMCLDGFGISHPGCTIMDEPLSVEMSGCRADYNCRQGLSLVGGKGHRISNSKFTNTGKGRFSSAPAAGIDIEAEQAVVRDVKIDTCTVANNVGVGIVADSGDIADVLVDDTSIFGVQAPGSGSYSVWPNKPRLTFRNCRISGTALSNYDAAAVGDANLFDRCTFYVVRWRNSQPFGTGLIDASTNGRFVACQFYAFDPAIHLGSSTGRVQFTNCAFIQNGSTATAYIRGRFYGDTSFAVTTGQCDWGGSASMNFGALTFTGGLINVAAAAGEVAASSQVVLRRYTLGGKAGAYVKRVTIAWDNPANAVAAFGAIDEVVNTAPSVGGPAGWVNVGGVWTRTGIVGAQPATGLTATSSAADIVAALKAANLAA